ncbi:TATA-binding protein-associated factor, partial [Nymphaea thermarum]
FYGSTIFSPSSLTYIAGHLAGSTQATRFAAARQIGDIARAHPQDLSSLLKKISQFLRSKNWDTRVAAAHAVGAIAENVRHTSLNELYSRLESEMLKAGVPDDVKVLVSYWCNASPTPAAGLSFESFDIGKVLEFGAPLLASGGQEYDVSNENSKITGERLARQKQNLRRRLGLDVYEQFIDVNDMIRDEDLMSQKFYLHDNGANFGYQRYQSGQHIHQLVASMVPSYVSRRLSARELNLLKRKAKVNVKDQQKGWCEEDDSEAQVSQNLLTPKAGSLEPVVSEKVSLETMADHENSEQEGFGRWPFSHFAEQLIHDMFDPIWEVRHGSVMALREILAHQAASAGVFVPDLDSEGWWSLQIDDKSGITGVKREREIDLNVQLLTTETQPVLKRQKSESNMSTDMEVAQGMCLKSEDDLSISNQGGLSIDPVKVEPELDSAGSYFSERQVQPNHVLHDAVTKNNSFATVMDVLSNFPEGSKLVKLAKLSRHSWAKNWEFLQECAIRLVCVLSLDRFGDYVSDQVVAPVRETCAQALGAVIKHVHPSLVHETLSVLLRMQHRQEWEVRHGSLLGIKYLIAVRQEMLHELLGRVLPSCRAGLEDPDDDVRAVAAEALIPAAAPIVSFMGLKLHSIIMLLWDILLDLDDLSPSTSSVMNLLAEVYSQPEVASKMLGASTLMEKNLDLNENVELGENGVKNDENPYALSSLAPRLWPFMRHSITSVRHAAISTLERLLEAAHKSSSESNITSFWPASILSETFRIVFQNLLLEANNEILRCSERVWRLLLQCPSEELDVAAGSYYSSWLELSTTPYGSALDATKMFWPVILPRKSQFKAAAKMRAVKRESDSGGNFSLQGARGIPEQEQNVDVSTNSTKIIVGADSEKSVTYTRVTTSEALGIFASKLSESSMQYTVDLLLNELKSLSGVQRQVSSMILAAWFKELKFRDQPKMPALMLSLVHPLQKLLLDLLSCPDPAFPTKDSIHPYSELTRTYIKMRNEAALLHRAADSSGLFDDVLSSLSFSMETIIVDEAISFASKLLLPSESSHEDGSTERHVLEDVESSKQRLLSTAGYLKCVQSNLHVTVTALVAGAVTWMSDLPAKLNPIILPLMAAIKREQEEILQKKAAEALAELIFCCISRKPSPNEKLIKNLCTLTCMDPSETPQAAVMKSMEILEDQELLSLKKTRQGEKARVHMLSAGDERSKMEGFIGRRGSELVLKSLCDKSGDSLFDKLPKLWDCLTEVLKPAVTETTHLTEGAPAAQNTECIGDPQVLINNLQTNSSFELQVVRSISPLLSTTLKKKLLLLLPCILSCLHHQHVAVRLAASKCITTMAITNTANVMEVVMERALPMLRDSTSVYARQGAGMLISLLVQGLGVELVPYAPLLVVPLLGCMSDSDQAVRQSVTSSFAALVPLLPLARGLPLPTGLNESLSKNADVQFLEQLLDSSHIDDYKLSTKLKVTLRRYQQEGINWLSFLKRFKLHGILCDDMGLGKTLQASAIVASDIEEQRSSNSKTSQFPSLVICPSTLVAHWAYEIEKYIDESVMSPLQYVGSIQERHSLRNNFSKFNVIITSYDVVRKDIEHLHSILWNYCILDEGHIIKNSKSKVTCAVKQLRADHRLILTGTPIQNNVLELWSLFDFLMPGFLGTERQFQATYGKPLLAAKDSKCSAKDAEAGCLAMEALHKQVMPFLLRRTKDEVLSDLPEKIIQDRYCDLSPVQMALYEQFSNSDARRDLSLLVESEDQQSIADVAAPSKTSTHVFQAIQYLLKVCSHPLLVLGEKPSRSLVHQISDVIPDCAENLSCLHELQHSPKLVALQEILEECGIGTDNAGDEAAIAGGGQHRALIFAQHKSFLDIIERDLFQAHMRSVHWNITAILRVSTVGGLGLNLTSADTLIFMEHDWNPMRDHQAMDRAHRLGQRKVVNVHRLIMRGTIEEKVMSLQKFKVSIANAIINADNASLKTMNTDQLLDLFTSADTGKKGVGKPGSSDADQDMIDKKTSVGGKGLKSMLNNLEELWDQSQYTEEYDVSQFLARLND